MLVTSDAEEIIGYKCTRETGHLRTCGIAPPTRPGRGRVGGGTLALVLVVGRWAAVDIAPTTQAPPSAYNRGDCPQGYISDKPC